jgi:cation transporter-like permease
LAVVAEKYGNALDIDNTAITKVNESSSTYFLNSTKNFTVLQAARKNFVLTGITAIHNSTSGNGTLVNSSNYSFTSAGLVYPTAASVNWKNVNVSYTGTYSAATSSSNVTGDLQTEIGNNTSIAGIILTISLVGIVLTILIGVFVGITRKTSRV